MSQVALWASFDGALTILELNVNFFLSQWLIVDLHLPEWTYALLISLSLLVVIAVLPVLGSISDARNARVPFLRTFSIILAGSIALIGVLGVSLAGSPLLLPLVIAFAVLGNFAYQGTLVFYNALLHKVAAKRGVGGTSGLGIMAGYIGALLGFAITIPFVLGGIPGTSLSFPWGPSRAHAFVPSALLFLLGAAASLRLLKDPLPPATISKKAFQIRAAYADIARQLRAAFAQKNLGRFFAAFVLFNDAILTVLLFTPLYLEKVLGLSDLGKMGLIVLGFAGAALSAVPAGKLADRFGAEKILVRILFGWVSVLLGIVLTESFVLLGVFFFLAGMLLAGTWTVSRALFVDLTGGKRQGVFFSFYSLFERVATVIGPLTFVGILSAFSFLGAGRYRVALLAMALLIAGGAVLLVPLTRRARVMNRALSRDASSTS